MRVSLLVAALVGVAAVGSARDPLPDAALKAATDANIAHLAKLFEGEKLSNPQVNRAKGVAMLVALAAQKAGNGAQQDQALAIVTALTGKQKDFAAAKAAAGKLAAASGGSPKGAALHEHKGFDLDVLMSTFSPTKVGGLNIEADLKGGGKKVTDPKQVQVLGARTALIADYTLKLAPADATGPKKKQWDDWSKEMGDLGASLAAEAGKPKPDRKVLEGKMKALEVNCTACHNVFRDGK